MNTSRRIKYVVAVYVLLIRVVVFSQSDSIAVQEITVKALMGKRPVLRLPSSVTVIDSSQLDLAPVRSLLPAVNVVPGVRMEERSPGSYRFTIRGSVLRSPFGVRNLKVYLGEMPLTNAGGETYLNIIDQAAISRIEIHKGPDGSLFGANSGGVVRMELVDESKNNFSSVNTMAGSFGLYRSAVKVRKNVDRHHLFIDVAVQQYGGYREHSAMQRLFVHAGDEFSYNKKGSLRLTLLFSSLDYQTPGGLTAAQFAADPLSARPATAFVPGAVAQKAGVYNTTVLGALSHEFALGKNWEHLICVFGSYTDFRNPFITNYEIRDETGGGLRTWLRYHRGTRIKTEFIIGTEQQALSSLTDNYTNNGGIKGALTGGGSYLVYQGFVFSKVNFDFYNRLLLEFSLSSNSNRIVQEETGFDKEDRELQAQFMPKLAASYLFGKKISVRGLVSRGYSPPSLQELRPAPGRFNRSLQPEQGWNYEIGARVGGLRFRADAAVFIYRLENAIVRQVDSTGTEVFVNSGSVRQPGVELMLNYSTRPFIGNRAAHCSVGATFYDFRFGRYVTVGGDLSGNRLTGVPREVYNATAQVPLPRGFEVYGQYLFTGGVPLNDANTVFATAFTQLMGKIGWRFERVKKWGLSVYAGCDNILNQAYSLGYDLNAFGGRFYNAAPGRNYFAQLGVRF